jgi:hypothetical protein
MACRSSRCQVVHYSLTLRGKGPNLRKLPSTYRIHGSRYFGIFGIVSAVVLGGQALLHFMFVIKGDPRYPFTTQDWIFGPMAVLFLLWGINQFKIRGELKITQHEVTCEYVSMFGGDNWSEPLRAYRGIKKIFETDSTSGAFGQDSYAIRLVHSTGKKSFTIYTASTRDHLDTDFDNYARLLGVEKLN